MTIFATRDQKMKVAILLLVVASFVVANAAPRRAKLFGKPFGMVVIPSKVIQAYTYLYFLTDLLHITNAFDASIHRPQNIRVQQTLSQDSEDPTDLRI